MQRQATKTTIIAEGDAPETSGPRGSEGHTLPKAVVGAGAVPLRRLRVLVVDDSRLQRMILASSLKSWGYEVVEAESGARALEICADAQPDMVISDWVMPGMDGLEFCKAFREMPRESYGYFILLTSKSDKDEIARGLEIGADDFLNKPFDAGELRARLMAGERILRMQSELTQKNRLIKSTLDTLQDVYSSIEHDLMQARQLQQSLIRENHRRFGEARVSLMLNPSGHVGGDLVGFYPINQTQFGIFAIDVSGHGISSALMTTRLAGYLSSTAPEYNIAIETDEQGNFRPLPPARVAEQLNRLVLEEMETEHYFTLILADVDLTTRRVRMVQAGHPHPIVQRKGGHIEQPGRGGLPVGLFDEAEYEEFSIDLDPGDRVLICSDGILECPAPDNSFLDEDGIERILRRLVARKGTDLLDGVMSELTRFADSGDFPDDVSAVLLEF